jgi:filamentous hemagglutinin family protein
MGVMASLWFCGSASALPQQGVVTAGHSSISQSNANSMTIHQTTNKSIINWHSYSIGAAEKVKYIQPNRSAISLNRVTGLDPSRIYGQLSSNGRVWVINPNGLLVGKGARINTGGFLASTLNLGDTDFIHGHYAFRRLPNARSSLSSIINQGNITAANGGYAVLISPSIINEGTINTHSGKTYLAAADAVTIHFAANTLVGLTLDKAAAKQALGITNTGSIRANGGGEVMLSAKVTDNLIKAVINNEGIIEARSIENHNGVIKLLGGMKHNRIHVSGTLDASAPQGGDGGFIETSAAKVDIAPDANITTAAAYGNTGIWLIDPADFTIAATGGDITGLQLSAQLISNSITIASPAGSGNGDIFVNAALGWSANTTLTLNAARNINVNADITATGNTAGLVLTPTAGAFNISNGAQITLSGANPTLTISGNNYTVINNVNTLQAMQNNVAGFYALGSDIDASATTGWNSGLGFKPVGTTFPNRFTGTFDGLGHVINKLFINRPTEGSIGLFGRINGFVRNVGLADVDVTGKGSVGGLVGFSFGQITNTYTSGKVTGNNFTIGGLVGFNGGGATINNSFSVANVTGTGVGVVEVGGLVGSSDGSIINAYSAGSVNVPETGRDIGGLVGVADGGLIRNTYSTISVPFILGSSSGGLVGNQGAGSIENSYSIEDITFNGSGTVDSNSTEYLTLVQMQQQATFTGFDFANVWGIDPGNSTPFFRWATKPTPVSTPVSTPVVSKKQTIAADRSRKEVQDVARTDTPQENRFTNSSGELVQDMFVNNKLIGMTNEDREFNLGRLTSNMEHLTKAQSMRMMLEKSPYSWDAVSTGRLKTYLKWLDKTYIKPGQAEIKQAKKDGLKDRTLNFLGKDLARYQTVRDNVKAMLQANTLTDGIFRAKAGLELTKKQMQAFKNADPAMRRQVANALLKHTENSNTGDVYKKDQRNLLKSMADGTFIKTAQHRADAEKTRLIAYEKELRLEAKRDAKFEKREARKDREVVINQAYSDMKWISNHHVKRVDDKMIARLGKTVDKMTVLHFKITGGKDTPENRAKFARLQTTARDIVQIVNRGYSDHFGEKGKDIAQTLKHVKLIKSSSLTALKALAFIASDGASAKAAALIQVSAAGLSNFVDNYQKDGAASALLNSTVNIVLRKLPGGKTLEGKLAAGLAKSLVGEMKNTIIAMGQNKITPEQANQYLYDRVMATYGKTVYKTFAGKGVGAISSGKFKTVLKLATNKFYGAMVKR